jgi:hypothetical protein
MCVVLIPRTPSVAANNYSCTLSCVLNSVSSADHALIVHGQHTAKVNMASMNPYQSKQHSVFNLGLMGLFAGARTCPPTC